MIKTPTIFMAIRLFRTIRQASLLRLFMLGMLLAGMCTSLSASARAEKAPPEVVATIPFEYHNDFIVIDLVLNGFLPLKFIFDTGAENTIITQREVTDLLGVIYEREIRIIGADLTKVLTAYLVRNLNLDIADLNLRKQTLLVFEEDYFHFQEYTGEYIHGIIGANIFRNFIVKINYQRQLITLYRPQSPPPELKRYESIPLEVFRSKPYVFLDIRAPGGHNINLKLLLDTGAGLSLMLHTDSHPDLKTPEKVIPGNIGRGLGGYLEGFTGKIDRLDFGSSTFSNIPTNFQRLPETMDSTFLNDRNGILGNTLLSRFHIAIDYINERLYYKPNRKFKKRFRYDRSGISLIASGAELNQYIIYYIVPDSPAARAGLEVGDQLKCINGLPASWIDIEQISRILSKKVGKKIKLRVLRGEGKSKETLKFTFHLEELL